MNIEIRKVSLVFPFESHQLLLIAMVGQEIVGTVSLREVKAGDNRTVQFSRLHVHREWLRLRIGRRLLDTAEEMARDLPGATTIGCYVKAENTGAQDFYRACGYQLTLIFDDGDLCFTKQLAEVKI